MGVTTTKGIPSRGVACADDGAFYWAGPAEEAQEAIGVAAGTVLDTFAEFGFLLNLHAEFGLEAPFAFAGPGSKTVGKALWRDSRGRATLLSRHFPDATVLAVHANGALGSAIDDHGAACPDLC